MAKFIPTDATNQIAISATSQPGEKAVEEMRGDGFGASGDSSMVVWEHS